jgi:hypothetical protein
MEKVVLAFGKVTTRRLSQLQMHPWNWDLRIANVLVAQLCFHRQSIVSLSVTSISSTVAKTLNIDSINAWKQECQWKWEY